LRRRFTNGCRASNIDGSANDSSNLDGNPNRNCHVRSDFDSPSNFISDTRGKSGDTCPGGNDST